MSEISETEIVSSNIGNKPEPTKDSLQVSSKHELFEIDVDALGIADPQERAETETSLKNFLKDVNYSTEELAELPPDDTRRHDKFPPVLYLSGRVKRDFR